jgi:bifunctional DNase/RNase
MTDHPPAEPVEVVIRALVVDPATNTPVVILAKPDDNAYLPIWIGVCEANAIAMKLEDVESPRPMTHDLMASLIDTLGFTLDRIVVHSLDESVFHASLHISGPADVRLEIDARPSDAIALALRAGAGVFVEPSVLDRAVVAEVSQEEAVKAVLEQLRPEDLGDYEM